MNYSNLSTPQSDEEALARIGDEEALRAKYESLREHLNIRDAWECIARTFAFLPEELGQVIAWLAVLEESSLTSMFPTGASLAEKLRAFYTAQADIDHYALIAIKHE